MSSMQTAEPSIYIACIGGLGSHFHERICRGIRRFVRQRSHWYFRIFPGTVHGAQEAIAWKPDGIIAHVEHKEVGQLLADWNGPVVNSSAYLSDVGLPYVGVDNESVGRMAGEHLIAAGYRRFAYIGLKNHAFSNARLEGFRTAIAQITDQIAVWDAPISEPAGLRDDAINRAFGAWLTGLPQGTGIMVCRDTIAVLVCDHAKELGLHIPDRISIISGLSEGIPSDPSLTAVRIAVENWGQAAAQILAEWIETQQRPEAALLLPPEGIDLKASTALVAYDDNQINKAITYIREHAHHRLDVTTLSKALFSSRRTLERRFDAVIGHSILHEIHRIRIEMAQVLMIDTNLPFKAVAKRVGFTNEGHLRRVFSKFKGESPLAFRQRFRSDVVG
jgi:LacI family transcriptional regulator